jgi:glycosyltransferase involved in cell wall biosynthesis
MTMFSDSILWLLGTPAVFSCGYLLLLTLCSGKTRAPAAGARTLRFDVIVPAHDEEALIGRVVGSLHRSDWPRSAFRIVVVADNCTDGTAAVARLAGAEVLERADANLRGKGYALEHAVAASRARGWADAVVVVDADSEVSANLLAACAARIESGAHAVQVHYGVLEPRASWRTRLLCIAMAAFHRLR